MAAYRESVKNQSRPPLELKQRKRAPKPRRLIAYDLETTKIQPGTPRPLYITAYGESFSYESPIKDMASLTLQLKTNFLIEELRGTAFVAWNGNRFDAIIIAAALLREKDFFIRPYLTRTKTLRGMKVLRYEDRHAKNAKGWEFLDGIAMLGLPGVNLQKLVANFAPDFPKLTGAIDFEREEFNAKNPQHQAYAMRDSEGLYHAMVNAQNILLNTFDEPLAPTMGGACIRIFQAHIPADVSVSALSTELEQIVHSYVMRGGFCYCVKRFRGEVWKYDINQAYASAMREAFLPSGNALHGVGCPPKKGCFVVRVTATNSKNTIPFYSRTANGSRVRAEFSVTKISDTWITSIEYAQLKREGWEIDCMEFYVWSDSFHMRAYVDKLETLRATCDGGPSGPAGTMVKGVGNHSYGKTVEQVEPIEYVLAAECPDDCLPYYADDEAQPIEHIYYRLDVDRRPRGYHQPHIGAWITAHVRMVVRRAALRAPKSFLYADTDCVIFSRDVTSLLTIDAKKYGAWKIEESGTRYEIIAKKVYTEIETDNPAAFIGPENPGLKRSAKGMNIKHLRAIDFYNWHDGVAPMQNQTQSQNFLAVMSGAEMYRSQQRRGTNTAINYE